MNQSIISAIKNMNLLEFHYDGEYRIVEPHTYGISTKGNEVIRAYQVSGGSVSDKPLGWKMYKVEEIFNLKICEDTFKAPRPGYKKGDSAMTTIIIEL